MNEERDAKRYQWIVWNWPAAQAMWHNTPDIESFGRAIDDAIALIPAQWTEWHGDDIPLDPKTKVFIRLRDGTDHGPKVAGHWVWKHGGRSDDIIAYKIVPTFTASKD